MKIHFKLLFQKFGMKEAHVNVKERFFFNKFSVLFCFKILCFMVSPLSQFFTKQDIRMSNDSKWGSDTHERLAGEKRARYKD